MSICPPRREEGWENPLIVAPRVSSRDPSPRAWERDASGQQWARRVTGASGQAGADTGPARTASSRDLSVFPLSTCCKDVAGATSVSLGCLVTGYLPKPLTVTWDTGSLNKSVTTLPATFDQTSGLHSAFSQVTAGGEWAKQTFTCSVAHADAPTINKTVRACATNFTPPTVKLFHSSCDPRGDTHTSIQLLCLISGYVPGDMEVAWLVDGHKVTNMFPYTAPGTQEGNVTSTHSELNITQGDWVSQKTYTCRVSYQGLFFEDNARKCTESEPRGVSSYLSPPSPLDLYVHKSPRITCLVVDLASTKGMSLTWSRDSREPVHHDQREEKTQFNGTISVTSTLPVNTEDWIEGETYHCTVAHPDLPKDIVRSIAKAPGQRAPPDIYVFLPPEEEEGSKEKVTLTCLVQNFFPADISVQWLRNDSPLQIDQHATTGPLRVTGPRPAFFVFSRLEVSRLDWEQRHTFSCQVVHEALPGARVLKKTISRRPELELQELCAEAAESQELDELWTSLLVFIALFLLSISVSAAATLLKVRWVLAAALPEKPPAIRDYANIVRPAE